MAKFLFITGGVASSSGKGITAASLGTLLKARGLRVTMKKFDPYLNVDPGTMNPYQHGEVFVTDDGMETDLDLGHYERFIDEQLGRTSSTTQGQVYQTILEQERRGAFEGTTVQVVPHVTGEIKRRVLDGAEDYDVVLCEIGGTVGDIEGQPFIEAIRQLRLTLPPGDCLFIHVTILPYIKASQELKTKPTQHSVKAMQEMGLQPDFIVCRSTMPVPESLLEKIAMFCNVHRDHVVVNLDSPSLYAVPLMLHAERLDEVIISALGLKDLPAPELDDWAAMVERHVRPDKEVTVAMCGKYMDLHDAYLSVAEALTHGGIAHSCRVHIDWVDTDTLDAANVEQRLGGADAILVPGGFGLRGMEGMIQAIHYARRNDIPFFGICLGLQMAVVEYARHVAGLAMAHTTEADPGTPYPVVDILPDQKAKILGGTLRLGGYACALEEGSLARRIYGEGLIRERHRHRYEVNDDLKERLSDAGLVLSGKNPESGLCEVIELPGHPFFIAVQYHPEFLSRPMRPHPIFRDFIGAAIAHQS